MKNIKNSLMNLILVITSGFLAYKIPLSAHILKINSDKILNGFDIAIYTTFFSIIMEALRYFFDKKQMKVTISIIERQQDTSRLVLRPESELENVELLLKISVSGVNRKGKSKLVMKLPNYFTLQVSRGASNFISTGDDAIELDLSKMTEPLSKKNLSIKREVEFNLSLDIHNVGNLDSIKFDFDNFIRNPLISLDSRGLTIEQKGQ
ncbi:TPA: hypothetical protein ACGOZT_001390 [Streptococcus suis]